MSLWWIFPDSGTYSTTLPYLFWSEEADVVNKPGFSRQDLWTYRSSQNHSKCHARDWSRIINKAFGKTKRRRRNLLSLTIYSFSFESMNCFFLTSSWGLTKLRLLTIAFCRFLLYFGSVCYKYSGVVRTRNCFPRLVVLWRRRWMAGCTILLFWLVSCRVILPLLRYICPSLYNRPSSVPCCKCCCFFEDLLVWWYACESVTYHILVVVRNQQDTIVKSLSFVQPQ